MRLATRGGVFICELTDVCTKGPILRAGTPFTAVVPGDAAIPSGPLTVEDEQLRFNGVVQRDELVTIDGLCVRRIAGLLVPRI
ncbi:MAG TPA: hypothetical protein VH062_37020 [Polyangiaceae bacterium]|nr:hypothetical protein [Polyangiaceae bacterium]